MKSKFEKLKTKIKDKKELFKQVNNENPGTFKNFFQALGIRVVDLKN